MDKEKVMDIVGTAFNIATGGRLEATGDTPVDKLITSEQVQKLNLTKEALIEAFLQDPRVIAAECKEGRFHVVTNEGTISFNFVFGDEGESPRFEFCEDSSRQEQIKLPEVSDEELARALLGLCKSGVTVEDLIETFLEDPRVTTGDYKNGRFYFQTTEGPLDFWLPFLTRRSNEEKKENDGSQE